MIRDNHTVPEDTQTCRALTPGVKLCVSLEPQLGMVAHPRKERQCPVRSVPAGVVAGLYRE